MKKKNKKEKEIKEVTEKEEVIKTSIGEVLQLVADESNPIGDGKEFPEEKED